MTIDYQRSSAAARSAAASINNSKLLIDGEYMTSRQVADRLDITPSVARERIRREQKKSGPVTLTGIAKK